MPRWGAASRRVAAPSPPRRQKPLRVRPGGEGGGKQGRTRAAAPAGPTGRPNGRPGRPGVTPAPGSAAGPVLPGPTSGRPCLLSRSDSEADTPTRGHGTLSPLPVSSRGLQAAGTLAGIRPGIRPGSGPRLGPGLGPGLPVARTARSRPGWDRAVFREQGHDAQGGQGNATVTTGRAAPARGPVGLRMPCSSLRPRSPRATETAAMSESAPEHPDASVRSERARKPRGPLCRAGRRGPTGRHRPREA